MEIVDLPLENGGLFHSYVNVYQRVMVIIWSRVKIVYGTFRGVPDVWNEGAS